MGKRSKTNNTLPIPEIGAAVVPVRSDLQHAIDTFDRSFRDAYGSAPTWGAKQAAQIKRLVSAHGIDEVTRRIGALFAGALSWPPAPYDLGVLVTHFDRLVVAERRGMRPSDVLGKVGGS